MVFKRRDKRSFWRITAELLWPRGGWGRAFHYVKHRLRRLPDPPHRIARGIFAGVFVTFSPLFGLHFFLAAFLAKLMRGNIVASLLATFFGNPLTFFFIAASSLQTGHFLLGRPPPAEVHEGMFGLFWDATKTLFWNLYVLFTEQDADWGPLASFYHELFLPYLVGGLVPGAICATACYYVSLPLIIAYKNRRKGLLRAKLKALKEKAAAKADARGKRD